MRAVRAEDPEAGEMRLVGTGCSEEREVRTRGA